MCVYLSIGLIIDAEMLIIEIKVKKVISLEICLEVNVYRRWFQKELIDDLGSLLVFLLKIMKLEVKRELHIG